MNVLLSLHSQYSVHSYKKSEYFLQNTYMLRQNVVERCTTAVLAEEYVVIMEYCAKAKITL